jgi:hypothetical protein
MLVRVTLVISSDKRAQRARARLASVLSPACQEVLLGPDRVGQGVFGPKQVLAAVGSGHARYPANFNITSPTYEKPA